MPRLPPAGQTRHHHPPRAGNRPAPVPRPGPAHRHADLPDIPGWQSSGQGMSPPPPFPQAAPRFQSAGATAVPRRIPQRFRWQGKGWAAPLLQRRFRRGPRQQGPAERGLPERWSPSHWRASLRQPGRGQGPPRRRQAQRRAVQSHPRSRIRPDPSPAGQRHSPGSSPRPGAGFRVRQFDAAWRHRASGVPRRNTCPPRQGHGNIPRSPSWC